MDPTLFRQDAIAPETAELNTEIEAAGLSLPDITEISPDVTREAREDGEGLFGPIQLSRWAENRSIPGPAGDIGIRVLVLPDTDVRAIYFHIHGGGWTLGRPHHGDVANEVLARSVSVAVVGVDYRLAPESPHPAAADDCEAVAAWLIENGRDEFGSGAICIGGESAGAHLAVVTLLRLRDKHGYTDFEAANLVYGAYDLRGTPSVRSWGDRPLVLNTKIIEWFTANFAPSPVDREDPDVSPLLAELHDLPPALFTVGTLDPLLDDSLFMYGRWLAAGNQAELAVYPGGSHAFDAFPSPLASRARNRMHGFLAAHLR